MIRLLLFLISVGPLVGVVSYALGGENGALFGLLGGLVGGLLGYVPLGNRYYRAYFRGAIAGGLSAGVASGAGWSLTGMEGWFSGLTVCAVGWPYGINHAELFFDQPKGARFWMLIGGYAVGWLGVFAFSVVLAMFLGWGVIRLLLVGFGWGFLWGVCVELDSRWKAKQG